MSADCFCADISIRWRVAELVDVGLFHRRWFFFVFVSACIVLSAGSKRGDNACLCIIFIRMCILGAVL